jgi:hypothetical protein
MEVGRAVVGENVLVPDELAGGRFQAAQFALGAQRVDAPILPHGRRARSIAAQNLLEERFPGMGPAFAAGAYVVGGHHLVAAALLDGERQPVGRGE